MCGSMLLCSMSFLTSKIKDLLIFWFNTFNIPKEAKKIMPKGEGVTNFNYKGFTYEVSI